MSTYTMKQVESISGISAHSLRIWERRYNFMIPQRTDTNIRYYTDIQLRKLINVGILLKNNYRISKVAKMDEDEMSGIIMDILQRTDGDLQAKINTLTIAMLELNEDEFNKIYNLSVNKKGVLNTFLELIYPFLQHLGMLWTISKAMPAQEHFVTYLIRQKLIVAIDSLPLPYTYSHRILLFLPEDEEHELGLLLANYIAKDLGWKTHYLGQNVPSEDIVEVIRKVTPDVMFSMIVSPRTKPQDQGLVQVMEERPIPWICSGNFEVINDYSSKITYLASPKQLIDYLENFKVNTL